MTALAELDAGWSAERLIPGSITALDNAVASFARTADQLVDLSRGLSYIELSGDAWSGQAARVYAAVKDADIASFRTAATVYDVAGATLADYVSVLRAARHAASTAVASYAAGKQKQQQDLASCTPPPPTPSNPAIPYDPYGLLAAADVVDRARAELAAAAAIAAPALERLSDAAPGPKMTQLPDQGPGLREIASAPWHLVEGLGRMGVNTMKAWGTNMEPQISGYSESAADQFSREVDGGTNQAVPALALLANIGLMVGGAKGLSHGEQAVDGIESSAPSEARATPVWDPGAGAAKVPAHWGEGVPNSKGVGLRWFDPTAPQANGIRIDEGIPGSPWPSQRVDHVVVRVDGRILGPDGKPIDGGLRNNPQAHIPLSEWIKWTSWDQP